MSIASASTTVKFHKFPTGTVIHNYQPGTQVDGPIRSISWSKDGNWLALVPHSGSAEIVSVKDQLKLIHTIQGIEEPSCASFQNSTKKNIAVGTKSGQVLLYDIKARNVRKRFPRATSAVVRVEFTAKDNHVVVACENGEAFIYSNVTNNLSGTFKIPRSQTISALRTNPIKRNYVVAGSQEGVVAVWDIHENKNKFFMGSHKAAVTGVAFSPVSSELVVSTGLDRQFCFYDVGINKCIGNIFVENSMASVDFSPDGKFIVMASQKGKIYVYDSKNIKQPLHSFSGHNSAVDHIAFRKTEEYETSFTISSENVKETESFSEIQPNEDSFGLHMMMYNGKEQSQSLVQVNTSDTVDSFMEEMGSVHQIEPNKQDFSFKASQTTKMSMLNKCTPNNNLNKIFQQKFDSENKAYSTSTPTYEGGVYPSPMNLNPPTPRPKESEVDVDDIKEIVEDTVKKELKVVSEEIKNDMKYYSTHVLTETRQMCLNLLMSMVKEFIKVENNFNNLRDELLCDVPQNQESLSEENFMLKQRIAALEEELSVLKNNQVNKDM